MSPMFRGKFMALLQRAWSGGKLVVDGDLATHRGWRDFKRVLYRKSWNVYAKRPFKGASHIYAYLGRYTHRVAIASARIHLVTQDVVRIRTRGDQTIDLAPQEFIRRFLLHVLPWGFRKIRHYGLYAPGAVPAARLAVARTLVEAETGSSHADDVAAARSVADNLVATLRRCPSCPDGRLMSYELPPMRLSAHPDDDPRTSLPQPDTP